MSIEGVDVSNHQATFDFSGWQFAIVKASEGNGFRDFRFWQHINAARAAGLLVAAYHYQRDVSAFSQFDLIRSIVPTSIPVILDVEDGSGSLSITRELIRLLREAGYRSPLLYLPRWHWNNIGRPSLAGLPPLWGSDYRGASADWSDYGGLPVVLRQYTSTPFDKNWFAGTREEFAALLGEEGDDVSAEDVWRYQLGLVQPDGTEVQRQAGDILRYTELANAINRGIANEARDIARRVEVKLNALASELTDDEADILAAIRALPAGTGGGPSVDQIKTVLREVFADAGDDSEEA